MSIYQRSQHGTLPNPSYTSRPTDTFGFYRISSCHVCTAGDDSQALIWDLSTTSAPGGGDGGGLDPILAYDAGAEISQLQWSATQPDWIAIAFSKSLQILRV